MDYLTPLERDYRRLVEVVEGNLAAKVPTCPDWTVDELVDHVGMTYLQKVAGMRLNARPEWPPADLPEEPALDRLRRAYGELVHEFATRSPQTPAYTWYGPDQTVGFWIRRMAQETVIHRIDGELAAGASSMPIGEDLALDGVDELLMIFMVWASTAWPEDFADELPKGDGSVALTAGSQRWLVAWTADGITAQVSDEPAATEVSGTPEAMLRWLWRRADDGVTTAGDPAQLARFRELLRIATQ